MTPWSGQSMTLWTRSWQTLCPPYKSGRLHRRGGQVRRVASVRQGLVAGCRGRQFLGKEDERQDAKTPRKKRQAKKRRNQKEGREKGPSLSLPTPIFSPFLAFLPWCLGVLAFISSSAPSPRLPGVSGEGRGPPPL